ncbi:MerR family transcriptional regulator [Streptomyces shenzhenensis]|uniref:MerR family transcriptional regulator n=1 Tax=Streptomyces shenzhenensis TaxID=943815 RepID=A0A3M0I760_9ACTN|nr:MerR family transcriptional regulator [Streptomyces shenzhenensis]RMB82613.1 MerR family transcriptional regulator [Streptomyces shenzhenensis]
MRIGEVADKAGVSVRALRYYEEQDLLQADRSPGGQRHYSDKAVPQVWLIQQLYAAGLPSRVVRQVLQCLDAGEVPPKLLEEMEAQRVRIEQQIANLLAVRDRLDHVIANTQNPGPDCFHER